MIKILENFFEENNSNFDNLNIEIIKNTGDDSAYFDFISEKKLGRIVIWNDCRVELEVLDRFSEMQSFFKYYKFFNEDNFDNSIFIKFIDEFKKQ